MKRFHLRSWVVLLILVVAWGGGCSAPVARVANPIDISADEYGPMFGAAVEVLRELGYIVEEQDYRFGAITARPMPTATAVEPWFATGSSDEHAWADTVNYQRRIISITFELVAPVKDDPFAQQNDYLMRTEVMIERLAAPVAQLTGSTQGRRIIGRLRRVPAEWERRGIEGTYWWAVGRDEPLEQRLVNLIVRRSMYMHEESGLVPNDAAADLES